MLRCHCGKFLLIDMLYLTAAQKSKSSWTELMHAVALAGLDGDFAGHSFRCGGTYYLYASNVLIKAMMRMGSWKSQAALLYLRCETVTALMMASARKFSCEHGW